MCSPKPCFVAHAAAAAFLPPNTHALPLSPGRPALFARRPRSQPPRRPSRAPSIRTTRAAPRASASASNGKPARRDRDRDRGRDLDHDLDFDLDHAYDARHTVQPPPQPLPRLRRDVSSSISSFSSSEPRARKRRNRRAPTRSANSNSTNNSSNIHIHNNNGNADPNNAPPPHSQQHLSLSSTPYYATKEYTKAHKYNFVRPLTSLLAMCVGFSMFPTLAGVFRPLTLASNVEQLDVLITGTFTPVVGILFAMLASTAVSSLRQRQQDLRDLLNQELALIRMLLVMIKDASIIRLLLEYTLQLENETFAHRENGISYEHERPGTDSAIRREEVFAESEETLWLCVQEANDLRLRAEVEATIRSLVVFRTKRRAVLDSGLPQIHFIITALLGVCMIAAFCLVATADMRLFEMTTARLLFGGLLMLLSLTYTLLRDLRDPFGGDYGVAPWRLYRTVELLRDRLGTPMQ